jgi:hypothetical protein
MVLVAISVVIIAGPKDLSHKYKRIVHENNLA